MNILSYIDSRIEEVGAERVIEGGIVYQGRMVSAAMAAQDQSGCARSNAVLPIADADPPSIKSVLLNEQFPSGDDYSPKVRKPYTITKQRERWTEEEHKKFLEALKLYGRAWRRIEEHVSTKSAVQIRSHAQKFFSKVVRESDASAVKPLEIPPPRPKRKPMHPYPRKVVPLVKTGTPLPGQAISESPTFSASEQANQSPTSVLSAVGSDTLGSKDSNTLNGSLSSVSSASGVNHGGFVLSESNPSLEENTSLLPAQGTTCSSPNGEVPMKLELFTEESAVVNKGSADTASTQSLKLFGKTLFVTDPQKPSSPTTGTRKSLSPEMNDWRPVQTSLWNSLGNSWSSLAQGPPAKLYYMQVLNENSDSPETGSNPSLPCWDFYGGMLPLHNPRPSKAFSDSGENQEIETQKEGSWTGSNTGPVNVGNDGYRNLDVETESHGVSCENEQKPKLPFTLNIKLALKRRAKPDNCMKGFVPYKRCVVSERENTESSSVTGEERAEQRIRLCL